MLKSSPAATSELVLLVIDWRGANIRRHKALLLSRMVALRIETCYVHALAVQGFLYYLDITACEALFTDIAELSPSGSRVVATMVTKVMVCRSRRPHLSMLVCASDDDLSNPAQCVLLLFALNFESGDRWMAAWRCKLFFLSLPHEVKQWLA